MAETKTATAEDVVRRAIADPGTHVPRGDNYGEPLPSWQARAVLAALKEHGLAVVRRDNVESAREPIAAALAQLDTQDVDEFEVVAEEDTLMVACPDLPCEVREVLAEGWHATVSGIIRLAREHEHRYPTQGQEASHA